MPLLFLIFFVVPAVLFAEERAVKILSPFAEKVAKTIRFDRQILIMVKQESGKTIHRMVGYDEQNFQIVAKGVFVPVPNVQTKKVLCALRKKLAPLNYMAFVIEVNENIKTDKIGVLKGTDQYEILRVMHTAGEEYHISNEEVIYRLKDWEKQFGLEVLGADNNWVEIEFKKPPANLKAFAEEVYEFCPGAVDRVGSMAKLAGQIEQTGKLFLVWD